MLTVHVLAADARSAILHTDSAIASLVNSVKGKKLRTAKNMDDAKALVELAKDGKLLSLYYRTKGTYLLQDEGRAHIIATDITKILPAMIRRAHSPVQNALRELADALRDDTVSTNHDDTNLNVPVDGSRAE